MIIPVLLLLALAPATRAEESFENQVESVMTTDWKKELLKRLERERTLAPLAAPIPSTQTAAGLDRILLRFSLEEKDGEWKDLATMSMTRKTFERYRRLQRRWEDDTVTRPMDKDPERYFGSFGGRDAAAVADVLFTGLADESFVRKHPWLSEPIDFLVEGMKLFNRFDDGSVLDVLGFEVNDFVSDRFGLSRRGEPIDLGPESIRGSEDGRFHGRLRVGVSGLEKAAMKFEADPLRFKVKYEIRCPRSFILDRVEIGGESRPFCREEDGRFRVYIGGGKAF